MYKKILVPLDGSSQAERIMPHVEALATCLGVEVVLLQVVEPAVLFTDSYDVYPELNVHDTNSRAEEATTYLAGWQARMAEKGIQAKRRVEYGPVVMVILDVAASEEVDLIAMASHGRTGLARVFYGSVAAGVLHRVDRPLLLIRAQ
jgi:nucleotide-binding universal stress UspA family protein